MESWNYEVFWKETENIIKNSLSKEEYTMWFNNISYSSSSENNITLSVPSNFFMDQIKQRYLSRISEILEELSGSSISVSFEVIKKTAENSKKAVNKKNCNRNR